MKLGRPLQMTQKTLGQHNPPPPQTPACTNLVALVSEELVGGLSLPCLRGRCVRTEVQPAPESQEQGCSVELKEGTTVTKHSGRDLQTSRRQHHQTSRPAGGSITRPEDGKKSAGQNLNSALEDNFSPRFFNVSEEVSVKTTKC